MMADFVTPRHSAVMERLRRRIEHFRQHHNSCESRYDTATLERLEHERQQTFNLHQRCLQAKAKRSNKHRQPQSSAGEQREQQAAQRDQGAGQRVQGGAGGEHQAAGESGGSAAEQSRNSTLIALQETVKRKLESAGSPGGNGFPPNKKACLETAGSPLDSKLGLLGDVLNANGNHGNNNSISDPRDPTDFHRKEMKQEPEDMLPILPPPSGNSLFPDLNLNEQEWTELMEELNCSVAYEDIQDILNDGFDDRKDPLESGGGASLLPSDLVNVKTESSFEQDSRTVSPHLRPPPPPHSPIASSSTSSSPSVAPPPAPPPRHHLAPPPKDLSPAQQLQQLAAQQQRSILHGQPQAGGAKFHNQGPHVHPQQWPPMAPPSQSALGGAFGLDKPSSPSLYQQDFNPGAPKQLQKAGYPNMMGHQVSGSPLGHPAPPGAQVTAAMLNYSNTKPLSHFEAAPPGPPRPQNTQSQNKAALLTLLRQQQQSKQKNMNFRHIPHTQDQNSYAAPPPAPGNNPAMSSSGVPPGNHGNTGAYLSSQVALKQQQHQQILEQQKQQYLQRQLLMAEQEKQRQQDQQLQRHLTRPPPQYQDQPGPPTNQNAFPQPPGNQFTASSQPMGSVGSMGGPAPSQRMFPQNQGILGMSLGGGPSGGVAPPPTGSDISLTSCGGDVLYNNNSMQQPVAMTRQPLSAMATATYRHSLLAQQHLKGPPNASMLKQQQQINARMPGNMQSVAWQQQQLANQTPPFSSASNAFHLQQQQQQRLSKMAPGGAASFGSIPGGRPMGGLNMMQNNMAAAQQRAAPNPQMSNQPQQQQQTANQSAAGLPDLAAFGQVVAGGGGRPGLQCNQGYQVSRTTAQQQQQQVAFGYNVASGSFAGESELVDSLLKGHNAQEWMNDLDELLAGHH